MALSIFNRQARNRDQIIAIDLGARTTKAVHIQRKGDTYTLHRFVVMDAPIFEKQLSVEALSEHLAAVTRSLEAKTKFISLTASVTDSVLRHAELPMMPVEDMRLVLKNNSKNYLQQDLSSHVFDCWVMPVTRNPGIEAPKPGGGGAKQKVIVGGARKQMVDDVQAAAKKAGLTADLLIPGLIGPVNAFELAMSDAFKNDAVALVDIGFRNSSICLLNRGELVVNRVIAVGGDRLTIGLAESMSISYAEAEGIKVGMPAEVQNALEPLISSLARELRASIDFFEHQQDRTISRVYISGGTARSEFIVKSLEAELMLNCVSWNPATTLQLALPPQQVAELEHVAPQLASAIGVAATI